MEYFFYIAIESLNDIPQHYHILSKTILHGATNADKQVRNNFVLWHIINSEFSCKRGPNFELQFHFHIGDSDSIRWHPLNNIPNPIHCWLTTRRNCSDFSNMQCALHDYKQLCGHIHFPDDNVQCDRLLCLHKEHQKPLLSRRHRQFHTVNV